MKTILAAGGFALLLSLFGTPLLIRALAKNNIDGVGAEIEKLINKLLDRASRIVVK